MSTDKIDYQPGETVIFTGEAYQPYEQVSIVVHRNNGPNVGMETTLTASVDGEGNFINTDFKPEQYDLGVTFTATATGQTSGSMAKVTFTDGPTPQASPTPAIVNYEITESTGEVIDPAGKTRLAGSRSDSTNVLVNLPFQVALYGRTFGSGTNISVTPDGLLQFDSNFSSANNICLPSAASNRMFSHTIFAYWDNLRTNNGSNLGDGIYTSVTDPDNNSTTPNRIFKIEWRAVHNGPASRVLNFEVRLYENQTYFDIVYGRIDSGASGVTVGVQRDPSASSTFFTQYECGDTKVFSPGLKLRFTPKNTAPVAAPDTYSTDEDNTLTTTVSPTNTGVLANDTDADNNPLTAVLVGTGPANAAPTNGFTLNADGSFSYTPKADFHGTDSFTYKANDGKADSNVVTVTITVNPVNDAPVAKDDGYSVNEDATLNGTTVLVNDTDVENDTLTAVLVSGPSNAAPTSGFTLNPNGTFTYKPKADFHGTDSFKYKANDGTVNSGFEATVTITVNSVNDTPAAANDTYSVNEDNTLTTTVSPINNGVLANDTDADGDTLTAVLVSGPTAAQGTLTLNSNGSFSFAPAANSNGTVTFNYKAKDASNAESNVATATITVNPVNDAPSFTKGADQTVLEDASTQSVAWATSISAGASNESGQTLTFSVSNNNNALFSAQPAIAPNGTLTYTPAANANGTATVTVQLKDNGGTDNGGIDTSAAQTFTVTITPVNDAPSFTKGGNQAVLEDAGAQSVAWATNISAGPADESGQTLAFLVSNNNNTLFSTQPAIAADGTLTYTPVADANGTATVTVQLKDNGGAANGGADSSGAQTFTLTVKEVNDAPTANADAKSTAEDTPGSFSAADLLTNDNKGPANESGQTLTVTEVSATSSAGGTVTLNAGTISYAPAANFNGTDSFSYKVCDNGTTDGANDFKCATGTVNVTVTEVNDPPSAANDSQSTTEDTAVNIPANGLTSNDNAGPANESSQTLTITAVGTASHGTVVLNGDGSVTYTPAANYYGTDSFTYTITDNGTTNGVAAPMTATGTVNVTVTEVNDPPTANADSKSTLEDTPLTFPAADLAANDSKGPDNESGQTLTVTEVSGTANTHGTVSLNGGNVTYTPELNYNGAASFAYKVCDNGTTNSVADSKCANGVVNMNVTPVNDAPIATDGTATTNEDESVDIDLAALVSDIETGDANLTYEIVSGPTNGTLSSTGANRTYTPNANYNGSDSFTYKVTDRGDPDNCGAVGTNCAEAKTSEVKKVSITVIPVNDRPVVNAGPDKTINEGNAFSYSGSFTDPDTDMWTATVNYGDGPDTILVLMPDKTFNLNHTYADNGTYTVKVTVKDNSGEATDTGTDTVIVTVNNVAPTVSTLGLNSAAIPENGSVTLTGSFTDPGTLDSHVVTINWGDGSANTITNLAVGNNRTFTAQHQYLDDNPTGTTSDGYTITVTVVDKDGGTGGSSTGVIVNNVNPVISSVTGPVDPLALGTVATVTANFTDAGTQDTHTCKFSWDDGTDSTVPASNGSCTATRTYTVAGVYTVKVTVTDDDTGSATSEFKYVVIYDPSAGFVTGGGFIISPAGAYRADTTLTGKANFGFVSKYKKGQSLPTGETEFQFHAGNFKFHSTVYEWLVVSGPKAQYKGSGQVNGDGDYGFILTATDGQVNGGGGVDKFRIKIWDKATGAIVYDNVLDSDATDDLDSAKPQAIAGGSITIHSTSK
ncbi:MAG: Ig-like domain-containing protein [Acidobacteriota bacterium]|nr:Ig-like domain-containing protein [Acidobacteriota bacterium]